MLKKHKILALIMAAVLLSTGTTPVIAVENTAIDILFVVNDTTEKERVLSQSKINEFRNDIKLEVITQSDLRSQRLPEIEAIAIHETNVDQYPVGKLYASGIRVYIYGDLTINDYIAYTGQKEFTSQVPVYNLDGSFSGNYVERSFSGEQRSAKQYQIICDPKDDSLGLLCTIDKKDDGNKLESYLNIIAKNYIEATQQQRATIVSSDYDIAHYFYSDSCSIHLTWILYRNYSEEDPTYDYFALESRVWGTADNSASITQTTCEHAMVYSSDHIIDSGPESDSSADSISFTLDLGEGGVTGGSITYNYSLDASPNITRDTSNYPRSISWTAKQRFFGSVLDDTIFKFATSWASTGTLAAIKVNYSNMVSTSAMGVGIGVNSGIQTETISFNY